MYAQIDIQLLLLLAQVTLQPSTAIANLLPGQLVSTQIRIIGLSCFKFTIALIVRTQHTLYI